MIIKILTTLIIAMTPVLELRAAIPFGVASGLDIWISILISTIGNIIPVLPIILFVEAIFVWMKKYPSLERIVSKMEQKANKRKNIIDKYSYWGLLILVAIPLPGTGAWTASLIAALFNLDTKKCFKFISSGVICAAIIVSLLTYGITNII